MNPQPPVEPDPPCGAIAYRIITIKEWFDPDDPARVKSEAFMRRRPRGKPDGTVDEMDKDGLSVYDSFHVDMDGCTAEVRSGHGLATLHVGTMRDLGLTVIRDPQDHRKLLITDIPFENPNDAAKEALLDSVAETARICLRRRWRPR